MQPPPPPEKIHPLFPSNAPLKTEVLSSPPVLKFGGRFNPTHPLTPYDWISKSAILEDFFENLFVDMSKEKISKIELNYWQEDKAITNCGITTGKELLQPQKVILFWPKWTRFWNPQVVVLICGHYLRRYQDFLLLTLIYLPWNMVKPWKWIQSRKRIFWVNKKETQKFSYFRVWFIFGQNIVLLEQFLTA